MRAAAGRERVRVVGRACLSVCTRACAAALLAPGEVGYPFGGLPPGADGAADLVTAALAHARRSEGYLRRAERPERLRAGILARLPPPHWLEDEQQAVIA